VAEVIGRELCLPARSDAGLRAGHDPGVVDQQVDGAARGDEPSGQATDTVEVGEVQLVDLHVAEADDRLLGGRAAPGGNHDVGARAGQRTRRLQPDARVAAGDHRELSGRVDPPQDLLRGALGSET
jgi:hypothetical protein